MSSPAATEADLDELEEVDQYELEWTSKDESEVVAPKAVSPGSPLMAAPVAPDESGEGERVQDKPGADKGLDNEFTADKGLEDKATEYKGLNDEALENEGFKEEAADDDGLKDEAKDDEGLEDEAKEVWGLSNMLRIWEYDIMTMGLVYPSLSM